MLVTRVEAMLGKVRRIGVVYEVIEWCDDRVMEDL